ncbi:hypothetical protein CEUSTIGMA_g2850.t1 [Chlamydomonas eustigma]|uniref:Protein kinase domain-containing protein n=1 Tax=Chlamydomonas eustigma TaxID=1157962 RepID=A0A250WX92_9CHLO|nr:hypothetical protein CEUSTIGMA_g2850.t1 [Chlamydomonas eustigma]|eukprot:GAX75406.1 hypothetical protein CEUSTIGMA_g2850.t1 [Chlamydomonas eustigma]
MEYFTEKLPLIIETPWRRKTQGESQAGQARSWTSPGAPPTITGIKGKTVSPVYSALIEYNRLNRSVQDFKNPPLSSSLSGPGLGSVFHRSRQGSSPQHAPYAVTFSGQTHKTVQSPYKKNASESESLRKVSPKKNTHVNPSLSTREPSSLFPQFSKPLLGMPISPANTHIVFGSTLVSGGSNSLPKVFTSQAMSQTDMSLSASVSSRTSTSLPPATAWGHASHASSMHMDTWHVQSLPHSKSLATSQSSFIFRYGTGSSAVDPNAGKQYPPHANQRSAMSKPLPAQYNPVLRNISPNPLVTAGAASSATSMEVGAWTLLPQTGVMVQGPMPPPSATALQLLSDQQGERHKTSQQGHMNHTPMTMSGEWDDYDPRSHGTKNAEDKTVGGESGSQRRKKSPPRDLGSTGYQYSPAFSLKQSLQDVVKEMKKEISVFPKMKPPKMKFHHRSGGPLCHLRPQELLASLIPLPTSEEEQQVPALVTPDPHAPPSHPPSISVPMPRTPPKQQSAASEPEPAQPLSTSSIQPGVRSNSHPSHPPAVDDLQVPLQTTHTEGQAELQTSLDAQRAVLRTPMYDRRLPLTPHALNEPLGSSSKPGTPNNRLTPAGTSSKPGTPNNRLAPAGTSSKPGTPISTKLPLAPGSRPVTPPMAPPSVSMGAGPAKHAQEPEVWTAEETDLLEPRLPSNVVLTVEDVIGHEASSVDDPLQDPPSARQNNIEDQCLIVRTQTGGERSEASSTFGGAAQLQYDERDLATSMMLEDEEDEEDGWVSRVNVHEVGQEQTPAHVRELFEGTHSEVEVEDHATKEAEGGTGARVLSLDVAGVALQTKEPAQSSKGSAQAAAASPRSTSSSLGASTVAYLDHVLNDMMTQLVMQGGGCNAGSRQGTPSSARRVQAITPNMDAVEMAQSSKPSSRLGTPSSASSRMQALNPKPSSAQRQQVLAATLMPVRHSVATSSASSVDTPSHLREQDPKPLTSPFNLQDYSSAVQESAEELLVEGLKQDAAQHAPRHHEPRSSMVSAPTRAEVDRAVTPTDFRELAGYLRDIEGSAGGDVGETTWSRYSISPLVAGPDEEAMDMWAAGDEEDSEYTTSRGGAGLEDELEVLSVSPGGMVRLEGSPSQRSTVTSGGAGLHAENDMIVDGVRVLGRKYVVQHVVGEGAYGLVMKCEVLGGGGKHVAIKSFKIEDDDPDAEDVKRNSRREVALLRALQHPHVVGLVDEFYVRDRLFIVMEFVPCNLLELLEAEPGGMNREAVRLILYQLCSVITYIHGKNVVYRDIKPENMLVDEQGCLKLCDFGFARYLNGPGEPLTDYVATRWYRAPELLLGPPFQEEGKGIVQYMYSAPIDMWAIGCLMGELLDGEPLFPGDSDLDQLYRIQQIQGPITEDHLELFSRNPQNAGITFNFKDKISLAKRYEGKLDALELDFLEGLLCMDPAKRLTGQQCLQHPYLSDLAGTHLMGARHHEAAAASPNTTQHSVVTGGDFSPCSNMTAGSALNSSRYHSEGGVSVEGAVEMMDLQEAEFSTRDISV